MIIVNTTFILHKAIETEMVQWIKTKYLASAAKLSAQGHEPLLTRVLSAPDPASSTYAIHIYFDDMATAEKWCEGVGASMRKIITDRFGEKVLMFHTYLEVTE